MSVEESVENELLAPVPRPIAERECACGCGVMFQPRRRDQIYLNSQHANYGYNHGKRKEKNKSRSKEEAILAKNDEVLNKHYKSERNSKEVVRYYDVLKADGFKFAYNIGRTEKNGDIMWYSYRYYYSIANTEPKQVKIYKR
jgi:hypothetical protein